MLMSLSLWAESTVEELNGFDWVTWSFEKRVGYIQGFMSAYSTVMEMIIYENGENMTEEGVQELTNRFHIPLSVGQIGERLDQVYSSYDNRNIPIYDAIMIVIGKDYWNNGEM